MEAEWTEEELLAEAFIESARNTSRAGDLDLQLGHNGGQALGGGLAGYAVAKGATKRVKGAMERFKNRSFEKALERVKN